MALLPGTRLGPYEVLGLLGAGGMGEVYRARDPRLEREVAVKVLPAEVAGDPERLARFEREARAVAALNHPNILTVFDVGTAGPEPAGSAATLTPYVVTELLQGETLREMVSRRAPTQRQVLAFAVQIARGLDAAHAKGIVHRDIKPENVFVTMDGRVKLLDFGLAKVADRVAAHSAEPTAVSPTGPGEVAGTLRYMSPEQVRGLPIDQRTDIFSFGVLLYELLAGEHPFLRQTAVATLTAILEAAPAELSSLGRGVPPALSGIVRRCLEKDRAERFGSARDLAFALEAVLTAPAGAASLQEVEEKSPYPGLSSFTEKDAAQFFGREQEVEALWKRLRSRRLLAVIGPSGAGKTSFVRAGVIPAAPEGWRCVWLAPGNRPFATLARALVPELSSDPETLQRLVGAETTDERLAALGVWRRRHGEVLLVVDQFEELFTLNPGEVQESFADLLGRLPGEVDVHVLLSLRDDFLMRSQEQAPLRPILSELTALLPLSPSALRLALVEPAKGRGYSFEDEALVAEMVESVEGARSALPLLAFAVSRLWEKRDREWKLLTRAAYEEIGGVAGALAQHAEATMDRVGTEQQVVREIFRNLVTAQATRAVVDREELLSAFPEGKAAEGVLRELIDARLLTTYEVEGAEGQPSHHRVEVVHESLLRAWPRLVRWQAQDEEGAVLRDQLKQAAHLWEEKGRTSDLLWTGTAYREFELWRERYGGALTALEEDFARSMREKARRRKRLLTAAVSAVIVSLAAVAIAISFLRHQAARARDLAREQALRAEASRLVALGRLELDIDPTLTLAYARASLQVKDTAEARRLALEALWRGPVASVLPVPKESDTCIFLSTSPDGQWLACSNWGSVITLFSADGKTKRVFPGNRDATLARIVRFSDDSRRFATFASGDPETVVWAIDGREVARLRPGGYPRSFIGDEVVLRQERREGQRAFEYAVHRIGSPEVRPLERVESRGPCDVDLARGRLIYSREGALFARPLGSPVRGHTETRFGEHPARVTGLYVADASRRIVSRNERSEVRIWDAATHRLARKLQGFDPDRLFPSPVLDARGTWLAWHSLRERAYLLWDLAGPPDAQPLLLHKSEVAGDLGGGTFTEDGRWLVTALLDRVASWPLPMPWPRVIRFGPSPKAVFTPDSTRIAVCGNLASGIYPVTPDAPPAQPITWQQSGLFTCYGVAVEPSGGHVLLADTGYGPLIAPIEGGEAQALVRVLAPINAVAFDPAGRWAATAACYSPDPANRALHVVDRRTGAARAFPLPGAAGESAWNGSVASLRFVAGGKLLSASTAGLYRWDPATGANERLLATPCFHMDASADGRTVVVACKPDAPAAGAGAVEVTRGFFDPPFVLLVIDLPTGQRRELASHDHDIRSVAVSPSGELVATGDSDGVVRVGRIDGSEPHLLVGGGGAVLSLAFSPDGRWIASTSGNEVRLWPMPDPSKPPLHTLTREALIATLDSLTNVRVVADNAAPTGWKADLAPFPGWEHVPTW
jgi:WD40 repeat protein